MGAPNRLWEPVREITATPGLTLHVSMPRMDEPWTGLTHGIEARKTQRPRKKG